MPSRTLFVVFTLTYLRCGSSFSAWNVTVHKNPGCSSGCDRFNVVYVKNVNEAASAHYLFAAGSLIRPSILILSSNDNEAEIRIDWDRLLGNTSDPSHAISLNNVTDSFAVVFRTLFEYNDTEDTADMRNVVHDGVSIRPHPFGDWVWSLLSPLGHEPYDLNENEVFKVDFFGNDTSSIFKTGGFVTLRLLVSETDQRNPQMPRLQFVPGSNLQFEVVLNGLYTNFTRGRFGLQLALISNDPLPDDGDFHQSSSFNIDDEVTPGIFETVNVLFTNKTKSPHPNSTVSLSYGFIQLKPVCYTSDPTREIKTSRDVKFASERHRLADVRQWEFLRDSLPYVFYGNRIAPPANALFLSNTVGIRLQNISFGTPTDGCFASSNFLVWTASFGYGTLPSDKYSSLLIGMMVLSATIIAGSLLLGPLFLLFFQTYHESASSQQPFDSITVTDSLA